MGCLGINNKILDELEQREEHGDVRLEVENRTPGWVDESKGREDEKKDRKRCRELRGEQKGQFSLH